MRRGDSPTRSAILTGAAGGLGRALALRLAADGWRLALVDVDLAGAEETLAQVTAAGGSGLAQRIDVSQVDQWMELRDHLKKQWPHLDLLINNAGVSGAGELGRYRLEDWEHLLATNLMSAVYGCHTFVSWLRENPLGGHIINIASAAAFVSVPTMAAYNVTKAGVVALSETLYGELAGAKIGVTVVCPGYFLTGFCEKGRFDLPSQRSRAAEFMRASRVTADQIAAQTLAGMRKKRLYVVPGLQNRWHWYLKRWLPGWFHKQGASYYQQQRLLEESQSYPAHPVASAQDNP